MEQGEFIRTVLTLVIGGGGVGWLSAFLSRRGQREENTNQRAANEATARLAAAAEDRAQLAAERARNDQLHVRMREAEDRVESIRAGYETQLRECRAQCAHDRDTLQATFESAIRVLTDDLSAARGALVRQVRHVADGGEPATVPAPDDDELGV